jgi:hypothetical protein
MKSSNKKSRKRFYGLVKIRQGEKVAWLSHQNKHGWSLGLATGSHTFWLKNVRIKTKKEVDRIVNRTGIVFVQLKDNKVE